MSRIILVGMMGSGKSTVGQRLATALNSTFADTDQILVQRLGRPISKLFELYGEETFRQHETAVLRSLGPSDGILATGGGIVLREENWTELRRLGRSFFLHVDLEIMVDRLEKSRRKRPLLANDDWKERFATLYRERLPLYQKADVQISIHKNDFDSVVEQILNHL
jgi:shikimate kinase